MSSKQHKAARKAVHAHADKVDVWKEATRLQSPLVRLLARLPLIGAAARERIASTVQFNLRRWKALVYASRPGTQAYEIALAEQRSFDRARRLSWHKRHPEVKS
jgi:hypothetical protein